MKQKKHQILTILIIILTIFVAETNAFSLSPPSYRYEYDEINGMNKEVSFLLRSSSSTNILLGVELSGALQEYVEVSLDDIPIAPGTSATIPVKFTLPPNLDLVGRQEARITFRKKVLDSEGGLMAITTALGARLEVTFAYPGEYITIINLEPEHVNQGEDTNIKIEVQARGMETTSFTNKITILNRENQEVYTNTRPTRYLERNQIHTENLPITSNTFLPGNYEVKLVSTSQNNEQERTATLRIGEADINLVMFEPENFTTGDIVEFKFEVENLWNGYFNNVYGVLEIENTKVTTRSGKLEPFGKLTIDNQYINLRELEPGRYEGTLTIHFDENQKTFDVTIESITPTKKGNTTTYIIILASILIIIALILIFLFKKTNPKKVREE